MWTYNYDYPPELAHHGILGQKWGVRRYQNPDGTLTAAGKKRLAKEENKWIKKNTSKITNYASKQVAQETNQFAKELMSDKNNYNKNGKLNAASINAFNRKAAELMSQQVSDITSPSGRTVKFVAKRSELGVYMALADAGYDMSKLKNGVWSSGRVAYKKTVLDKAEV